MFSGSVTGVGVVFAQPAPARTTTDKSTARNETFCIQFLFNFLSVRIVAVSIIFFKLFSRLYSWVESCYFYVQGGEYERSFQSHL